MIATESMPSTSFSAYDAASATQQYESLSQSPEPSSLRVSTTFYPGAPLLGHRIADDDDYDDEFDEGYYDDNDGFGGTGEGSRDADIVLTTVPESIHFYVHSHLLLRRSNNAFAFLITPPSSSSFAEYSSGQGSAPPSTSASGYPSANQTFANTPNSATPAIGAGIGTGYGYNSAYPGQMQSTTPGQISPMGSGGMMTTPDRSGNVSVGSGSSGMGMGSNNSVEAAAWASSAGNGSGAGGSSVTTLPNPDPSQSSTSGVQYYPPPPASSSSSLPSSSSSSANQGGGWGAGAPRMFIHLHEKAEVLNLLLHAVYNLNPARYAPSLETLSYVPGALLNYGYSLEEYLAPDSELTRLFLNYARAQPVDVYSIAAAYGLEHIAQRASKPTLGAKLSTMTDDQVIMMGSVFLRRLIHLHVNRLDSLKKILLTPPARHPRDNPVACDGTEASVLRAWALAVGYLAWDATADISSVKLAQILGPLLDSVQCSVCKHNLQTRISNVLSSWARVKDTI